MIMDKFLKSIKVINLFEQNSSCYLAANEDKKTIKLVRTNYCIKSGELPRAADWKVKWVTGPTGALTGKCRLHSIHKKVLVVRREGEGEASYLRVFQDRWPATYQDTVGEWTLSLKQHSFEAGHEAQLIIEYEHQSYLLAGPKSMMCSYDRFATPRMELLTPCKFRLHNWIVFQVPVSAAKTEKTHHQQQQQQQQQQQPQQQQQQQQQQSVKNDSNRAIGTINSTYSTTSSTIAVTKDGYLSSLTGWQVGQVVLNYYTSGVGGGGGGGFSQYAAGHNVNGSGTQTNGDISVRTEIGKTRDVSVNFINNKA